MKRKREKDPTYCAPGGCPKPLSKFRFSKENSSGFFWEIRVPGTDCEETWESGKYECHTLIEAVLRLLPDFESYRLTLSKAAKLLLELGLVLGTGVEISEREDGDDKEEKEA